MRKTGLLASAYQCIDDYNESFAFCLNVGGTKRNERENTSQG